MRTRATKTRRFHTTSNLAAPGTNRRASHCLQIDLHSKSSILAACLAVLWLSLTSLSAEEFGLFTYEVHGDYATITDYRVDHGGHVVIPAEIDGRSVTSIGGSAFRFCTLTSIDIPDSVTSIEGWAFYECRSLTDVTIGNGVTTIGQSAFSRCDSLTDVTVGHSVNTIGDNAFQGCSSLTTLTIPDSVTAIGEYALSGCFSLTTITIPDSVTTIGDNAFAYCISLTNATVPDSITSIGGHTFQSCISLTTVSLPESVVEIGQYAFASCDSLSRVSIPDSVTTIGISAFAYCENLVSITIPDSVTSIPRSAFERCIGLTSIAIPMGVTSIENRAFSGCSNLTDVIIANSVTDIGYRAFARCSSLGSITLPASVTTLGGSAFDDCTSLEAIFVAEGNPVYGDHEGVLYNSSLTTLLQCPMAKSGSYSIPEGVSTIGSSAFTDCTNLSGIVIPEGVTEIGELAINGCHGLASITLPSTVTTIVFPAISNNNNLETISVARNNPSYTDHEGILYDAHMSNLLVCPEGKQGTYEIPEGVTNIAEFAFTGCGSLISISIPSTVNSIGNFAFFHGNSNLQAFHVDESNTTYADLEGVLCDVGRTKVVRYPEGKEGSHVIPEGFTAIGFFAFYGCHRLTTVQIPASVTSIGAYAYGECPNLSAVVFLGDAPTGMNPYTFTGLGNQPPPHLTIYHLSGSSGFTSPTMHGIPTVEIDLAVTPAATWLIDSGLPHDTDLSVDSNGDGVNLLMAYALNLDPNQNLRRHLPVPVVAGSTLTMTFHGSTPGITYGVETSTDLQNWTTTGVTLSEPDLDGQVTASVDRNRPGRFLRLVVAE